MATVLNTARPKRPVPLPSGRVLAPGESATGIDANDSAVVAAIAAGDLVVVAGGSVDPPVTYDRVRVRRSDGVLVDGETFEELILPGGGSGGLTAEEVRDLVAAFVAQGAGITVTHDDAGNKLTIAATGGGGGGLDAEAVRDLVGATLVAGANVTVTPNDAGDTITISAAAGGGGAAPVDFDVIESLGHSWIDGNDGAGSGRFTTLLAQMFTATEANFGSGGSLVTGGSSIPASSASYFGKARVPNAGKLGVIMHGAIDVLTVYNDRTRVAPVRRAIDSAIAIMRAKRIYEADELIYSGSSGADWTTFGENADNLTPGPHTEHRTTVNGAWFEQQIPYDYAGGNVTLLIPILQGAVDGFFTVTLDGEPLGTADLREVTTQLASGAQLLAGYSFAVKGGGRLRATFTKTGSLAGAVAGVILEDKTATTAFLQMPFMPSSPFPRELFFAARIAGFQAVSSWPLVRSIDLARSVSPHTNSPQETDDQIFWRPGDYHLSPAGHAAVAAQIRDVLTAPR